MTRNVVGTVGLLLLAGSGCKNEGNLIGTLGDDIAVTQGDFDDVAAPFNRLVVAHESYEGIIAAATWDDEFDPANNALKVETLFSDGQEIAGYDTIFVASGTRGFGLRRYNGLDPDDSLVKDEFVIDAVTNFVARGGNLVVTDWAYDLVEACWPDAIEFLGDDATFDAAQAGEIGNVTASISQEKEADLLRERLGTDTVSVRFDFSNWAVIEEVSNDVTVWETADITYRERNGEGTQSLSGVPILVSFAPNGADKGKVVFLSYHIDAQTEAVIDDTLRTVVGEFEEDRDKPVAPIE
jgi:hypothetical protein